MVKNSKDMVTRTYNIDFGLYITIKFNLIMIFFKNAHRDIIIYLLSHVYVLFS